MKSILLSGILLLSAVGIQAQQREIDGIIKNLNEVTLHQKVEDAGLATQFMNVSNKGRQGGADDLKLYLEVNVPDSAIADLVRAQKPDGSWPDIDYADQSNSSWSPKLHAIRFQTIVKTYKTPSSAYYMSKELDSTLHRAMKFWFNAKLKCPNWWYNDVGIPMWMGPGFLLVKDELTAYEKAGVKTVMNRKVFRATGQNKVWDAGNAVMYALLTDSLPLLRSARDSILSEVYMTTREGLQPDFSFHQHGPLMQFGNYGLAYISNMAYWARVFHDTPLRFGTDKIQLLGKYIMEGIQWTIWKGNMDVSACGRQVFLNAQKSKVFALSVAVMNMIYTDSSFAKPFNFFLSGNLYGKASDFNLTGHNFFWRSDYTIHRTQDWYASVRMNSVRTKGIEQTNRENLQGFYASDGVMSIMIDGNEYNNISPIWNWRRLPGLTAQDGVKPTVDYSDKRPDFTGDVNDGIIGASAMVLRHDGLTACKSYFFMDGTITCLGAGISTVNEFPVYTSMDQPLLNGDVTLFAENGTGTEKLPENSEKVSRNIKAVYHHKTGYCLLESSTLHVANRMHTGNWNLIADFYKNVPDSGKVFDLFIEHGTKPQNEGYAYCILPNTSEEEVKNFIRKPVIRILANTTSSQAVTNAEQTICQAVFYIPGKLSFAGHTIESMQPGMIMVEKQKNGRWKISVEDPTQKMDNLVLHISGKFSGNHASYDSAKNQTVLTILLPAESGYRGRSVSFEVDNK